MDGQDPPALGPYKTSAVVSTLKSPSLPKVSAGGPLPFSAVFPLVPARPVAPVAPVGPAGPVARAAPVAPVAPAGPVGPVAPVAPVAPAGPVGPVGPAGSCWFHEIAVVPFGHDVPASWSTRTCEPFSSALVQQPWITPDESVGLRSMGQPAAVENTG